MTKQQKFINLFDNRERKRLPFNWCDRWCERCDISYNCQLFRKEQKRALEHSAEGRDPHDPMVMMEDVKKDFEKVHKMLKKDMKKSGIGFKEIMEEVEDLEIEFAELPNFSITKKSEEYMEQARLFISVLFGRMQFNPYLDEKIKGDIEVLNWYHTLLPTKLRCVLTGLCEIKTQDGEDDEFIVRDAYWTSDVVFKSINLSKNALENILVHEPGSESVANNLLANLKEIEEELIRIMDIAFGKHLQSTVSKKIVSHQYNFKN